jgi:O-antigen ligase
MKADIGSRARSFLVGGQMDLPATAPASASRVPVETAIVEHGLFWALVAGLAWCPFWFGSNEPLAWGINALLFPGLVVIYEISLLVRGECHPIAIKHVKAPAALFAVVVLWIFIQNATWTPGWLHHPIWKMSADALERPIVGSISVDRDLTTLALLRLITSASALWIALQLSRDAARAYLLLWSVAAIGCAYAGYGLFVLGVTPGQVLWYKNPFWGGVVSSTFISPDSYAAYAGVGLVTICALILRLYRDEFLVVGGSFRFRIATFVEVTGKKAAAPLAGAFVILVALLLSGSRGGIAATALGLAVLVILTLRMRRRGSVEQREVILIFGALLAAVAFIAFGDVLVGKISRVGIADEGRVGVYAIMVGSILDAPWLGYGYGTFADVFPMFRDQSLNTSGHWGQAHNTYLEVFQGLGLPFGLMLVASVVLLVLRCVKGAMVRRENELIPCVAASVGFLLGAHALVDFSLQMQAVAITFMAMLGAGVAQSASSRWALED